MRVSIGFLWVSEFPMGFIRKVSNSQFSDGNLWGFVLFFFSPYGTGQILPNSHSLSFLWVSIPVGSIGFLELYFYWHFIAFLSRGSLSLTLIIPIIPLSLE